MTREGYDFGLQAQLRSVAGRDIDFPCPPRIVGRGQDAAYIRRLDKVSSTTVIRLCQGVQAGKTPPNLFRPGRQRRRGGCEA